MISRGARRTLPHKRKRCDGVPFRLLTVSHVFENQGNATTITNTPTLG
jgi:hypothetical protein